MGLFSGLFDRSFKMRDLRKIDSPPSRSWINHIDETREYVKEEKKGYLYLANLIGGIAEEESYKGEYVRVGEAEKAFEEALEKEEDKNLVLKDYAIFLMGINAGDRRDTFEYVHEKNFKGVEIARKLFEEKLFLDDPLMHILIYDDLDRACRMFKDKKYYDDMIKMAEFTVKQEKKLKKDLGGIALLFEGLTNEIAYSPNLEDEYPIYKPVYKLDPIKINKTFLECINTKDFEFEKMTKIRLLSGYGAFIMNYAENVLCEMLRNYKTEEFDENVTLEVKKLAKIATEWFDESMNYGMGWNMDEQASAYKWINKYDSTVEFYKAPYIEYRKNGTKKADYEEWKETTVENEYTSIPEFLRVKDVLKKEN